MARVSGPRAIEIAGAIWRGTPLGSVASHTAHYGTVADCDGNALDQAVATVYIAPRSFTGEDVVELSVHGSTYVQRALVESLVSAGARLAEAGEFTRRAFLNGRIDLAQAEGIADVIAADSRAAHRLAASQLRGTFSRHINDLRERLVDLAALLELELDFSEEDVEFASRERLRAIAEEILQRVGRLHDSFAAGNAIKEGIPVVFAGATNAGKSSLLNELTGDERAIVSDIHGTTRDTIEETVHLGDFTFRLVDTAGIRRSDDTIERIGISRAIKAISRAGIIVLVSDITVAPDSEVMERVAEVVGDSSAVGDSTVGTDKHLVVALSKSDLAHDSSARATLAARFPAADVIEITTVTAEGTAPLRRRLVEIATSMAGDTPDLVVANARHAEALGLARESCRRIIDGLTAGIPVDLVAQDVRETVAHLADITGAIPSSEILSTIFSRFCIGK